MDGENLEPQLPISFGPFQIIPSERQIWRDGRPLPLGGRAFDLLLALAGNAGRVVSKRELIARVWPGMTVEEGSLRFHIVSLRKALGDGTGDARYIVNVPRRGYCFVAPTERAAPAHQRDRPSRGELPIPARHLVGREEVVTKITALLSPGGLVTVTGPGGIGKTTVALVVAHRQFEYYEGEVHFLDLAPISDPALVANALAGQLGLVARSTDPIPDIIDLLRERRALILLDSCEHVLASVATLVERLTRALPALSILATSREQTGAPGEQVVELGPLGRPPDDRFIGAPELMQFPATKLFLERSMITANAEVLSDADVNAVMAICRELDGNALAIEIVGARVAIHGLHETEELIHGRFYLSWRAPGTFAPRHQTLQATLDWSYALANDIEQKTLRRLAVFQGPFTMPAAVAVAADETLSVVHATEALEGLIAKSLISVWRGAHVTRYRLLDTTKAYTYQKLCEAEAVLPLRRRHAAFLLHLLNSNEGQHATREARGRKEAGRTLLGDLEAALAWSFSEEGDAAIAVPLAAAAAALLNGLSLLNEVRHWTTKALRRLPLEASRTPLELQLQSALGNALMYTGGNSADALDALENALRIARHLDDNESQFRLLGQLHMFRLRAGELSRLIPIVVDMIRLAAIIRNPDSFAAAHTATGVAHHLMGAQQAARVHLEAAVHLSGPEPLSPNHFAFHRTPLHALSRTLWLVGLPDQALDLAHRITAEAGPQDVVSQCISLICAADVAKWVGRWQEVEELARRIIDLARQHSLKTYFSVALGIRGERLAVLRNPAAGAELLKNAIEALRVDGYGLYIPAFAASRAMALAVSGHAQEGLSLVEDALATVRPNGGALHEPEFLRLRGEIQLRLGRSEAAVESFEEAIRLSDDMGALSWRLRAVTSLARWHARNGYWVLARDLLQPTYDAFTEGIETADLLTANALLKQSLTGASNSLPAAGGAEAMAASCSVEGCHPVIGS